MAFPSTISTTLPNTHFTPDFEIRHTNAYNTENLPKELAIQKNSSFVLRSDSPSISIPRDLRLVRPTSISTCFHSFPTFGSSSGQNPEPTKRPTQLRRTQSRRPKRILPIQRRSSIINPCQRQHGPSLSAVHSSTDSSPRTVPATQRTAIIPRTTTQVPAPAILTRRTTSSSSTHLQSQRTPTNQSQTRYAPPDSEPLLMKQEEERSSGIFQWQLTILSVP